MSIKTTTTTRSKMLSLLFGMAIGAVVGGSATLLLTPRSGKGTRDMLKDRALQSKQAIIWHAREEAGENEPSSAGKSK